MMNIRKGYFSGEQDIENTQEFICRSDDGFFMLHALFSFPFVVDAKGMGIPDSAHCHLPDGATQMSVAPFGDSVLTFEFSGFLNDWVNACAGNDFFMRSDGINGWHFCNEVGGRQIANAWYRSEDIHWFLMMGIYFFNELGFDGVQFFFQFEQSFDTAFQDLLSVIIINTDGIISDSHDFSGGKFYFSAFASGNFFNDFSNFFLSQFTGDACGRDCEQKLKHGFGEDVVSTGQFVKDIKGDLFNSIFEFRNFLGDYFVFPTEEFSRISSSVVFDFVRVFEQESGNGFCRDFVGGGFPQSAASFEVFDQQRIKERNVIVFADEEGEDIDVVAACGFNTDGEVLWVADGLQVFQDFVKFFFGLGESFFGNDFFLGVKGTEVQSIKGCIYADKIFIFRHGVTSFFALGGLNNGNRTLSLPSSKVIRDLCPNQLIGNGESRGQTPYRALGPGLMSSPCFQPLSSISSLIISKLYSNST